MDYISSFKRYETKYLLTAEQTERFLSQAGDMLEKDEYGSYTIRNIYLDTDDFYFIERSLDKPEYKEKLRVRSYGEVNAETNVFFEIKKKYDGVVYKRRIILPYSEAVSYLESGAPPRSLKTAANRQIFAEIDYLMRKFEPSPKLYLAYDREAYCLRSDRDVRVTLDRAIRGRWDNVMFEHGDAGSLVDTGYGDYRLLELKSGSALPMEITKILSENRLYPASFSKYGKMYTDRISEKLNVRTRSEAAV